MMGTASLAQAGALRPTQEPMMPNTGTSDRLPPIPAEKLSAVRTRFRVKVPARGEAEVTYRLRIVW